MRISIHSLLAGLLLGAWTLHATPLSITVSPTTITNDFVGTIQLSISNLSSAGAMVRVDRFLDATSNGIVVANDFLVQSFYVTDGQEPLFDGVRNSNVPGDNDGLANQIIQCGVPYPSVNPTLSHVSGQYIYRVTDLGNQQTAAAILGIAQQILPQGVTGQVFTSGGTPLANATVVVAQETGNDGIGAVSDGNGNFTVYAPPGSYGILTVDLGQLANVTAGLTINSNAFATDDLTNIATDGTTISGKATDSVSGAGLPGIFIQASTSSGLNVITFTSTTGAYTLLVNSNKWTIKLGSGEGAVLGYCRGTTNKISVNASSGSVSNVNFQLIKGNALVYGTVTTAQSSTVVSVEMDASDTNNDVFDGRGLTDINGNYSVAVVAGGDQVEPDSSDLTGYIAPFAAVFTVGSGKAVQENFVLQPVGAFLSGVVQDNFGTPIANIEIVADPAGDTNGSLNETIQSGSDGSFSAPADNGTWTLALECNTAESDSLISEQLTVIVTNDVSVSGLVLVAQHATASIYGRVTDSSGHPLSSVSIFANATVGTTNYVGGCVSTDTNGDYSTLVFPAEWSVGGSYPGMTNQNATVSGTTSVMLDFVIASQSGPPNLSHPVLSGGQIQFQVSGNNGQEYRIDTSTNLLSNAWLPVYTNFGSFPFSATVTTNSKSRFYRAVAVP
jgi:hypothetical protein